MATSAYSGSNKQHAFSQVPSAQQSRSTFDRSSNYKTTFNAGELIPFYVDEILPGDTVKMRPSALCRMSTPIWAPMDNIHLDFFWFFVPNRLVWNKWANFLGEEETPGDAELPPKYGVPIVYPDAGGWGRNTVFDYVGLPTKVQGTPVPVSALPFRAMNLIYSEWFRDENLIARPTLRVNGGVVDGSGNVTPVDDPSDFPIFKRGKRHDYFTSALPFVQKGPAVKLPVFGDANVMPQVDVAPTFTNYPGLGQVGPLRKPDTTKTIEAGGSWTTSNSADLFWDQPRLYVDLATADGGTINDLRNAFQVQRLLERDARGGTRLTELIRSHFGVISPDARLQRPEFLGGGTMDIGINPVPQTSATGTYADTPIGNLSSYAVGAGQPGGWTQSFTEHGHIIGFFCARADLNYQDGVDRMWSRKTRYDFYWPALQNLGEQAVLNKEIFLSSNPTVDEAAFGYQERWAEYRYRRNLITGQFRSDDPLSLDAWHLAQEFEQLPTLGQTFIEENPPIDRVVAVPSEPQFLIDVFCRCKHTRPMPTYSVPGLIDHF